MFSYDKQYVDLNSGAHRHAAPLVGTPSLIWHRAFWKPDSDYKVWWNSIDSLLLSLFLNLERDSVLNKTDLVCPNFDKHYGERPHTLYLFRNNAELADWSDRAKQRGAGTKLIWSENRAIRHDLFSCSATVNGTKFNIAASLHHEYWTLTIIADFSENFESFSPIPSEASIIFTLREVYKDIKDKYESEDATYIDYKQKNIYNDLVGGFRSMCERAIHGQPLLGSTIRPSPYGGVFADFIGIVLGLKPAETLQVATGRPSLLQKSSTAKRTAGQPTLDYVRPMSGRRIMDHIDPGAVYSTPNTIRLVDAIWPFIRFINAGPDNKYIADHSSYGKPEVSISLLHGGRSLYITSLGRSRPESEMLRPTDEVMPAVHGAPVIYTVVNIHASRWQLGRLIDRVHDLGTLRLAALRDFRELRDANDRIRDVQAMLNENIDTPTLVAEYAKIDSIIPVGLKYRIERSKYYVGIYRDILDQMRIDRVEGFQRYDELIKRRVFDKFSYIDRMGIKYDDLRRSISLRVDFDLQRGIENQNTLTNTLLENAEIIILVPIAYYVAHVIMGLFNHSVGEVAAYLVGVVAAVGLSRFLRHRRTRKNPPP